MPLSSISATSTPDPTIWERVGEVASELSLRVTLIAQAALQLLSAAWTFLEKEWPKVAVALVVVGLVTMAVKWIAERVISTQRERHQGSYGGAVPPTPPSAGRRGVPPPPPPMTMTDSEINETMESFYRTVSLNDDLFYRMGRGVTWTLSGAARWTQRQLIGEQPDFKRTQNLLILNSAINHLSEVYTYIPFTVNEEHTNHHRHYLIATITREANLDDGSEISTELAKIVAALFDERPEFREEWAGRPEVRRAHLLERLTRLETSEAWRELVESGEHPEKVQLIHQIATGIVEAGQWDLFEGVVDTVLAGGGVEGGLAPVAGAPLAERLEQEFAAMDNPNPELQMPMGRKLLGMLRGQLGFGFVGGLDCGFRPSEEMNYFSHLYTERYRNEEGEEQTLEVFRFPTPTGDNWSESEVVGVFRLWLQGLAVSGRKHLYFGHQRRELLMMNREGMRTAALERLGEDFPETFFFVNLPLDGALFNQQISSLNHPNMDKGLFREILLEAAIRNEHGFYFPEEQLREALGEEFNLRRELRETYDEVAGFLAEGEDSLSRERRQVLMLAFYARLEVRLALKLKASRNSTCKDGIDRAGVVNALSYYLNMLSRGVQLDEKELRQLRVVLHHAAFFVKTQAIIPHRRELIIEAVATIEDLLQRNGMPDFTNPAGMTLQQVSLRGHEPFSPFRFTKAATAQETIDAMLVEPAEVKKREWNNFIHDFFYSGFRLGRMQDEVPGHEGVTMPHQTVADIRRSCQSVDGQVAGSAEELYESLLAITGNDVERARYLSYFHSQAAVARMTELLMIRYMSGEVDPSEGAMLRQYIGRRGARRVGSSTRMEEGRLITEVVCDYRLIQGEEGLPVFVRGTLIIDHTRPFDLAAYEQAAIADGDGLDVLAADFRRPSIYPDAFLSWETRESEFPPIQG